MSLDLTAGIGHIKERRKERDILRKTKIEDIKFLIENKKYKTYLLYTFRGIV
jgi:hypothetical protein